MTRDDIIRLARLGFPTVDCLAALVAIADEQKRIDLDAIHSCHADCQNPICVRVREAVAAEREACLDLVNQGTGEATSADALKILHMERDRISAAIRARGET